jgi:hypothetical protein
MPLHAQVLCIGGNVLIAAILALAGFVSFDPETGGPGLGVFLLLLAGSALYSAWVHLKFKRMLAEEMRRRAGAPPTQEPAS